MTFNTLQYNRVKGENCGKARHNISVLSSEINKKHPRVFPGASKSLKNQLLLDLGLLSGFLEASADLEGNSLGSLDLDLFTGERVAAFASSTFLNRESTETDQLNEAVLLDTGGDTVEHSVNCASSSGLGFNASFLVGEDGFDEILLIPFLLLV